MDLVGLTTYNTTPTVLILNTNQKALNILKHMKVEDVEFCKYEKEWLLYNASFTITNIITLPAVNSYSGEQGHVCIVHLTECKGSSKQLTEDVKHYRDTKSISHLLVEQARLNEVNLAQPIYRGDCTYPSLLKEGQLYRFHNHVSSWSFNKSIAEDFAKTYAAPDWYFDDSEWCGDYDYPFAQAIGNGEELVPILIILEDKSVHGLITADYIDVENDTEYVGRNEEEVIVGDTDFYIQSISPTDNYTLIHLSKAQPVIGF